MEQTDYVGVGLTDLAKRQRGWEVENGPRKEQTRQQPIAEVLPEDVMSKLEELAGDAGGKVVVGATLAHSKEYGNKAEAFVSFSVTTDNNLDVMREVHDFLQPLVRELVNKDLMEMMADRDSYLGQAKPQAEVRVHPAARALLPAAGRPAPGPKAPKPGVQTSAKTPDFRR